jgi:hypothetical protein
LAKNITKTLYRKEVKEMRKAMLILALMLTFATGCATTRPNPIVSLKKPEAYMLKSEDIKEAIRQAVLEMQEQMEENFKRKIHVKEKAKVDVSTVEVISAKWEGLVFRSIGDAELSFTLKELNGLRVEFDRYDIRVVCKYYSLWKNKEASRAGHFYFEQPIIIQPRETKIVSFKTNGWVRKTINSMNEKLSFEEIRLYLKLHGMDANGNRIRIRTESAPI